MSKLSDEQIEKIIDFLKKGVPFPKDYRLNLLKYLEQTKNSLLVKWVELKINGDALFRVEGLEKGVNYSRV